MKKEDSIDAIERFLVKFREAYFEHDWSHFIDAVHWHVPSGGTKGKSWHFLVSFPFLRNFADLVEQHVGAGCGYHETLFLTILLAWKQRNLQHIRLAAHKATLVTTSLGTHYWKECRSDRVAVEIMGPQAPTSEMFGLSSSSSAYKPRTHCYHAMGTYGQHDCVFSVVLRFKIKEDVLDFARACGEFLGHKMCCDLEHISSDCDSLRNEVVDAFNEGRV